MKLINIQSNFTNIISGIKSEANHESNGSNAEFWISERNIENLDDITQISKFKVLKNGTCVFVNTDDDNRVVYFENIPNKDTEFIIQSNGNSFNICAPMKIYDFKNNVENNDNKRQKVTSFDIFEDEWAIFGTDNGMVYLYSLISKTFTKTFQINDMEVLQCKFFPKSNGTVIITVSFDYSIRIWNLEEEINDIQREVRKFTGHIRSITDLKFIGDIGRNFITSSEDGTVKLWECGSGLNFRTFNRIHKNSVNCITILDNMKPMPNGNADEDEDNDKKHQLDFDTKGRYVAFGDEAGTINIFDLFDGFFVKDIKYEKTLQEVAEEVVSICSIYSSDCELYIVAGFSKGSLRIINYSSSKTIKEFIINKGVPISCVKNLDNDSILISSNNDTLIQLNIRNYKVERYFSSYGNYNKVEDCTYHNKKLYIIDNYDRELVQFQL